MRLDLFLKVSRLVPRRTLAQELCDKGRIRLNGSAAKSSRQVAVGDELEIRRRDVMQVFRVAKVPSSKQVSKGEASELTTILREEIDQENQPVIPLIARS
jgi:ribosomal 50S subunit-recycling heat shock protein